MRWIGDLFEVPDADPKVGDRALEATEIRAPIVVRLDGTNAEEGRALLAEANRPEVTVEKTMLEAAATAVRLAGEAG